MRYKNKIILEIVGEGGSVKLCKYKQTYFYTTDESAILGLLDNMQDIKFKNKSLIFDSFEDAMESLKDRYPVFHLYPLEIDSDFKEQIKNHYQSYINVNKSENYRRSENWERILN